jgi:hypothetical protein
MRVLHIHGTDLHSAAGIFPCCAWTYAIKGLKVGISSLMKSYIRALFVRHLRRAIGEGCTASFVLYGSKMGDRCGIGGLILVPPGPVKTEWLKGFLEDLAHRGPDDHGWVSRIAEDADRVEAWSRISSASRCLSIAVYRSSICPKQGISP